MKTTTAYWLLRLVVTWRTVAVSSFAAAAAAVVVVVAAAGAAPCTCAPLGNDGSAEMPHTLVPRSIRM